MTKHQVDVAAESLVASLLAQAGYEVFVQYGANQPGYDLVAVKNNKTLRVSVKGTQERGWIVTGGYKSGNTYAEAADKWCHSQGTELVFAYVQFHGVKIGEMPEVFIVRAKDVAAQLKASKGGTGDTTLRWRHTWQSGIAKGITDTPPDAWKFSEARIDSI